MLQLPSDPHLRRWMLFVDGENFAIRAEKVARDKGIKLVPGPYYMPNVFAWLPGIRPTVALTNNEATPIHVQPHAVRAHCYTSVSGDEQMVQQVREALWSLGFAPEVFKKVRKDEKAKGVDIALTRDLLSHAHFDNYDVAVVMSGDGDYVPVLNEVKRLGKVVYVGSFPGVGLSNELRLASDMFFSMEQFFCDQWERFHATNAVKP
jgi:uncharacterized LabA/DUF88 family protein